ncbi:hypothetical protein HZH68_007659 [Vespula germanica]|uniref:Uncharacterized protein n=1 Tax=Vespula germanica TaxID=30212 RepID=A0A834NBA6_VESGE|nr:hypothetical protein HZH68_007659 [Vespula germanica]
MRGGPNPPGTVSCLLCPQRTKRTKRTKRTRLKSGRRRSWKEDVNVAELEKRGRKVGTTCARRGGGIPIDNRIYGGKLAREGDGIEGMLECERNLEMEGSAATATAAAAAASAGAATAASWHERGGENEEAVGRLVRSE